MRRKKRLLGSEEREEQDLLLVFCRPRISLEAIPRVWPFGDGPEHLEEFGADVWDLPADENPLLPPEPSRDRFGAKSWENQEGEFLRERGAKRRPFARGPR